MDRSGISGGPLELLGAAADASSVCCGIGNQGQLVHYGRPGIGRFLHVRSEAAAGDVSAMVDSQISTTGILSAVYGQMLHSSGGLIYRPLAHGVEILDTHHENLDLLIGDPNNSLGGPQNLALSHDGSRLFVADSTGLRVIDLTTTPLSIGSLTLAAGPAAGGSTVMLRGSGFTTGTTVAVDGQMAQVQFLDPTKLQIVTPPVTWPRRIR